MSKLLLAFALIFLAGVPDASAQSSITAADRAAIASVWNDIAAAVRAKDRLALEKIYTEDFLHVHAIGKIDDRKTRLDVLLGGEVTIDTSGAVEMGFRKFGDVIVAVGKVSVNGEDGKAVVYAVTRVYAKQQGKWRFASSHASPVASAN